MFQKSFYIPTLLGYCLILIEGALPPSLPHPDTSLGTRREPFPGRCCGPLNYHRSVKGVPRRMEQTKLDSAPGVASFGPVQDPCVGKFPWERVSPGEQQLCENILMLAQCFLAFKRVFS